MIKRYSREEMVKIWEDENKYRIWLEIETHACYAQADLGVIPKSALKDISEKGNFSVERIDEIEKEVKHDVIAFLTSVAEFVGEDARFIHQGMTSSDVIDTSFSVQLAQSADILIADMEELLEVIKVRVLEHKLTPCVGRSHGIHAEPTSFGLKLASHYAAFKRGLDRLRIAKEEIAICAISGAVGTFATISPKVEEYVADKMGLKVEPVSTQVIPRDRHAMFFSVLGVIASSIENLAIEIRHLQRTEVREAQEFFSKNQKGSSAMPHKKNPILTENLTGLARIVRSAVIPALENVALWHERDISHSSVERMIAPDSTITLDFALKRLTSVMKGLIIYPENMLKNLDDLKGLVFSQAVLLELTQSGVSREIAYRLVQSNAMKVWDEDKNFKTLLLEDEELKDYLSEEKINKIFDYGNYLKNVETIIDRAIA